MDRSSFASRRTAALALCVALALLGGCGSVPNGMVAVRTPGQLAFSPPVPLDAVMPVEAPASSASPRSYAEDLYTYAAMAENVYHPATAEQASRPRRPDELKAICERSHVVPIPIGAEWELQRFPANAELLDNDHNLRMQLWTRKAHGGRIVELAAVFRGTEANHGQDWWTNTRWFHAHPTDHYTLTANDVAPQLRDWLKLRIEQGDIATDVRIVATGHSLGGGLAQHLAYAFLAPPNAPELRISRVYAFDPSPVTGWFGIDKTLRERNADGMLIDRVLEDGEALSYVRDLIAIVLPPSEKRPAIRGMKFDFKHSHNPFSNHAMRLIPCSLAKYTVPGAEDLDTEPLQAKTRTSVTEVAVAEP